MKTFDRYLLTQFFRVYCVGFIATFGLFVVIDGFTNIDDFQKATRDQGSAALLASMAGYYGYQSCVFFDLVGSILTIVAGMVVFALLQKQGEVHPILAAGIPVYRLAVPVVLGTVLVNTALVANQEVLIPKLAPHLQAHRRNDQNEAQDVESIYDYKTRILISGRSLFVAERKVVSAEFVLPVGDVSDELTTLRAEEALHRQRSGAEPAGWMLRSVSIPYERLKLTPAGRQVVLPGPGPGDVFIRSDVSFDRLQSRSTSHRLLSTAELMRRIQDPSLGMNSVRAQLLQLHARLTRPLVNIIGVLMTLPFVIRKEGRSLIDNMALCTLAMGILFGSDQLFHYLGRINYVGPDLAAWSTVILSGSLCAWSTGLART